MDQNSDLELDFKFQDNMDLADRLSEYTLPNLKEVKLVSPQLNSKKANRFLRKAFPPSVELLVIDGFEDNQREKIAVYLESLCKISDCVKKEIWIGRFTMNSKRFIKILEEFRH